MKRLIADRGYDADALRATLRATGTTPIIPGRRTRKKPVRHDRTRYKDRSRIEAAFCRLKDFRRVATRYDKLAANFLSGVALCHRYSVLALNKSALRANDHETSESEEFSLGA